MKRIIITLLREIKPWFAEHGKSFTMQDTRIVMQKVTDAKKNLLPIGHNGCNFREF